jgi:hypothetical protein
VPFQRVRWIMMVWPFAAETTPSTARQHLYNHAKRQQVPRMFEAGQCAGVAAVTGGTGVIRRLRQGGPLSPLATGRVTVTRVPPSTGPSM